jgi:hypothetical protein
MKIAAAASAPSIIEVTPRASATTPSAIDAIPTMIPTWKLRLSQLRKSIIFPLPSEGEKDSPIAYTAPRQRRQ